MNRTPRVALLMGRALGYSRAVLRGVMAFARQGAGWDCKMGDPERLAIDTVAAWRPAGIIAHVNSEALAGRIAALKVPVVNVSTVLRKPPFPTVSIDSAGIGHLAARYFLEKGFRRFGFVGYAGHDYSRIRQESFIAELARARCDSAVHLTSPAIPDGTMTQEWAGTEEPLRRWLAALDRPAAVLACNDLVGMNVVEACRRTGVKVPEDVAVLGVDDDELLCELSTPGLSSVNIGAQRVGYEAARRLAGMLASKRRRDRAPDHALAPVGVTTRGSSDVLAIEDPAVAEAVRFIRAEACRPEVGVDAVVDAVAISRRGLERRFRRVLGRSPLEEIRRVRVERARELLAGSELGMKAVARRCGFSSAEWMSVVFNQEAGEPPTTYRRRIRGITE